jgi:hypothetical protein
MNVKRKLILGRFTKDRQATTVAHRKEMET